MEAFHYRYHPVFMPGRASCIAEGARRARCGGSRRRCASRCRCSSDIRYQLGLAGGATMDAGCYAIHMARHLAGSEPEVVVGARPAPVAGGRPRHAGRAALRRRGHRPGHVLDVVAPAPARRLPRRAATTGELRVFNPLGPDIYHRLTLRTPAGEAVEHLQPPAHLRVPARGLLPRRRPGERRPSPDPADAIANMDVIDAVYRAAGLEPRSPTP